MADGMLKPELELLPQVSDRMTFIYLERCRISRQDSAIKVIDDKGVVHSIYHGIAARTGYRHFASGR